MADFKKLAVFHKSHALALNVIRVSAGMRGPIALTIRSQMVRAALSVPTNIVEGSAKGSDREFARFTKISLGSVSELEYHLMIAVDTGLISQPTFERLFDQVVDVRKMLTEFLQTLQLSVDTSALKARRSLAGSRSAGSR
jgi:four helix bundle protein